MGKAVVFLVIYSLCLIGLFFIFLYLLSTVNPYITSNKTDDDEVYEVTTTTTTTITTTTIKVDDTTESAAALLLERTNKIGNVTSTATAMTTAVVLRPTYATQLAKDRTTRFYREIDPNNDIKRFLSDPHFEGFRKSGNDVQLQPSGNQSIIFKILDNDGSSRVEIKINNNKKRKKSRKLRDNSRQKHPQSGVNLQKNDTQVRELSNVTKDTVLILLPNNTLVYEVVEPETHNKIGAEDGNVAMIEEYLRKKTILLTPHGPEEANSSGVVSEITVSDSIDVTTMTRAANTTILVEDVTKAEEPTAVEEEPTAVEEEPTVVEDAMVTAEDTILPAEDPMMTAEDNMMPVEDTTLLAERVQAPVRDVKSLSNLDLERANEILLDNSLGKVELENYLRSIPTLIAKTTQE